VREFCCCRRQRITPGSVVVVVDTKQQLVTAVSLCSSSYENSEKKHGDHIENIAAVHCTALLHIYFIPHNKHNNNIYILYIYA